MVPLFCVQAAQKRRFTLRDSIEFSSFLYPGRQFGQPVSQATFSPDRSHFVVATMRGDLASGKREATMWVFDSAEVRRYLSANSNGDFSGGRVLTRIASAANREPLGDWRWAGDSRALFFLTADDDGSEQLHRIGLDGGNAAALSLSAQDVSKYAAREEQVLYFAHAPIRSGDLYQAGGASLQDIEDGTGNSLLPLLFPHWMDTIFQESEDELWAVDHGKPAAVMNAARTGPVQLKDSKLSISPDGRRAVVTRFVAHIPKSWERYQPLLDYPGLHIVADTPETEGSKGNYRPQQYDLLDLESGEISMLIDAPIEFDARYSDLQPQWSHDGTRIALPGAYPPIANGAGAEANNASAGILPCMIMVMDLKTKALSCVQKAEPIDPQKHKYADRQQMVSIEWRDSDRELVAEFAAPNTPNKKSATVFTQNGDAWTSKNSEVSAEPTQLEVTVQEGIDQPPVLMARIGEGTQQVLFDPNSQLKEIALGTAEFYKWRDPDGDEYSGALVKPPDFSSNRRYPLVIQTHELDRSKYLIDGPSATGFAARAFAARDIVVLQVDETNKGSGTPKESQAGAKAYAAAIKQLAAQGIVDPARVGIIGWSHMGPYVLQGLVDDPHTYAAATLSESSYDSYGEYLMNIDYMGKEREQMFRAQFGAQPFGEGLKKWLDLSPGFHTDRIRTPVLFQFNSPAALVYGWDMYAALRAQNKPVELLYLRNGDHVLVKPLERLAEQGMNVDWYDFWLNGHEDPGPAKAKQYARWREYRKQQAQ